MNYRFMRIIVFFDLPILTNNDRREYRKFRKYLIKNGFSMMQESVYVKLVPTATVGNAVIENVKKNKPSAGLVQALKVTEKQFNNMEYVVGERKNEVLDSDERLVIL